MAGSSPEIWIATGDGRNMIRADAIVVVRLDAGRLTAQLHDEAKVSVTLVDDSTSRHLPSDFHRQLIKMVAELAEASGAQLIRPQHDKNGWHWSTEPI
jgi:hypothetical protein